MLASCNYCSCHFDVVLENKTQRGVTKTFFRCPECGEEYVAYFRNPSVRKMQRRIALLYKQMENATTTFERNVLMKVIAEKEEVVRDKMDELRLRNINEW